MNDSDYIKPDEPMRGVQWWQTPADIARSHAVADDILLEMANYIEQAQIIVEVSERKGASILHGMGRRILERYERMMNND